MPNSILWIGLVVLWVFVLFPMLAGRHPRIRQTTDAALATRVLHRGDTERRLEKRPAAGHDTDPDYVPTRRVEHPHTDDAEDRMTKSDDETAKDDDADLADSSVDSGAADADLMDVGDQVDDTDHVDDAEAVDESDVVDEDGPAADERVDGAPEADLDDEFDSDTSDSRTLATRADDARDADEFDDETDELDELDDDDPDFVPSRRGRGGYDPEADAIARAARYRFRQRAVLGLACSVVLFGAGGLLASSNMWWLAGLSALVLGGYLGYLRKQVNIEEDIRRRRAARLARSRGRGDDDEEESPRRVDEHQPFDRESARTQLRRATLLEPDDEDPMFEQLEMFDAATARETRQRAAGGRMRHAVGE